MKLLVVLFLATASQALPAFRHNAVPIVQADGHLSDTPEVAAEKAKFNNLYNQALFSTGNFPTQFNNPIQNPANFQRDFAPPGSALGDDGTLLDTYEVSKNKAEHYRETAISRGLDTSPYDEYLSFLAVNYPGN